jgi:hypothetical protein
MTPHTCYNGRGPRAHLMSHQCARCRELATEVRALAFLDPTPGRVVPLVPRRDGVDAFDAALETIRKVLAEG